MHGANVHSDKIETIKYYKMYRSLYNFKIAAGNLKKNFFSYIKILKLKRNISSKFVIISGES